jgi:hypothetical protein
MPINIYSSSSSESVVKTLIDAIDSSEQKGIEWEALPAVQRWRSCNLATCDVRLQPTSCCHATHGLPALPVQLLPVMPAACLLHFYSCTAASGSPTDCCLAPPATLLLPAFTPHLRCWCLCFPLKFPLECCCCSRPTCEEAAEYVAPHLCCWCLCWLAY